jgi:hypothetical protein
MVIGDPGDGPGTDGVVPDAEVEVCGTVRVRRVEAEIEDPAGKDTRVAHAVRDSPCLSVSFPALATTASAPQRQARSGKG